MALAGQDKQSRRSKPGEEVRRRGEGRGSGPSSLSPTSRTPAQRRPRLGSPFPALTNVAFDGEPSGLAPRVQPPGEGHTLEGGLRHGTGKCAQQPYKQPARDHPSQEPRNQHFRREHFRSSPAAAAHALRRTSDVTRTSGRKWVGLI